MAATTIDTLLVRIEADLSQVKNQLGQFDSRLEATQKRAGGALNKLGGAFKLVIGAVIVRELARGALQLAQFASHVEEMQSKSSVVFGRFAGDVRTQLQAFGEEVGRSAFQLEEMAASVQDTFVPMGFARGEAAQLSVQLAKLATDVASFNNASDTETMAAFQSALVGNHETVRRFGIVITEATLQQELYRMGINKTSQEATNAEKVQARLNLIVAGTSDAQGDAARTSQTFANQSKRLSAELENLAVGIMTPLMGDLGDLVGLLADAAKATRTFLISIGVIPRAIKDLPDALEAIREKNEELAAAEIKLKGQRGPATIATQNQIKALNAEIDALYKRAAAIHANNVKLDPSTTGENDGDKGPTGPDPKELEKTTDAIAKLTEQNRLLRLEANGASESFMAEEDAMSGLTAFAEGQEGTLRNLARANHELGNVIKLNTEKTKEREAAEKKATETIKELELQNNLLFLSIVGATEAELKAFEAKAALNGATDDQIKKIKELIVEQQNLKKEVEENKKTEAANDNVNDELRRRQEELAVLQATLGGATDAELELLDVMQRHANLTPEQVEKFREVIAEHENLRAATQAQTEMQESLEAAFTKAGQAVSDALVDGLLEGKVSLDDFTSIFKDFIKELIREAIRAYLIKKILGSIFGSIGGFGGGGGDANITATGGSGFAGGGAVRGFAGGGSAPMLVGERGPELFVPHSAGSIKNNMDTKNILGGAGNGVVVNQTINVETGVAQTVRAEMMSLMPSIKQDTIQAVLDARRRGGTFAQAFGG